MKKILITAGGTATAWHITQIAHDYFNNDIEIQVCDINEPFLIPSIVIASKVHKVPLASDPNYSDVIGRIIDDERIDCIIPLIPEEAYLFAKESEFVKKHNVETVAPILQTTELLADKRKLFETLCVLNIPTPRVFQIEDILGSEQYLLKPRLGFGSQGVEVISGEYIRFEKDRIIQEYCKGEEYEEITVEVYNGSAGLHIFARRRVETKAGVCVKMVPVDNKPFYPYIKKLTEFIACPIAFNVQFLYHQRKWKLFDCNLRLGAGTALSSAIGFQLTRALLAEIIKNKIDDEWFKVDPTIKSVLRVYQEVAVR